MNFCCISGFYIKTCLLHLLRLLWCSVYGEPIPIKELADRVASYVHLCTLYWWLRFDWIVTKFSFIMIDSLLVIFLTGTANCMADLLVVELFLRAMTEMDRNCIWLNHLVFHM